MTIFFPDVSRYTPNVDVSRYPVVIAKATMSDGTHGNIDETDPTYPGYKAAAAKAGTLFLAYHWLNHGNLQAQARHCFSVVGPGIPLMIDAEDKAGNTGYNGPLTVDDITGFAAAYRALGGTVSLAYLPFWYWSGAMGAPHTLDQLTAAGLHLVSSNYPNAGYSETGPGWAAYYQAAPAPVQWQYTSTPVDMNAYRGTVAEYAELVGASMALTEDDINKVALATALNSARATLLAGATYIAGYPSGPASELGKWNLTDAVKDIGTQLAALGQSAAPTQDQVDEAVSKVLRDPAWMSALVALLPQPPTAGEIAKAVNDDAAARLES